MLSFETVFWREINVGCETLRILCIFKVSLFLLHILSVPAIIEHLNNIVPEFLNNLLLQKQNHIVAKSVKVVSLVLLFSSSLTLTTNNLEFVPGIFFWMFVSWARQL
jgi:hypothetical protein